jgi:hypothetical protein
MLNDIYTEDELWKIVQDWDGRLRNKAIIKAELGKVRLAVASSIEMYISESYLMYLSGHMYKEWEGITLDEDTTHDLQRTIEIQKLFSEKKFSLPFDYAAFDHQVTTREVQKITKLYFELADPNIPVGEKYEHSKIISKVIAAYGKSTLEGKIDGKSKIVDVTGGLPSGVRVTSLVGNIWNGVLTRAARDITNELLGYDPVKHVSLRGDDSLIICNTALECYVVRLAYQSLNAIGHSAKFGITQGEGEFLRCVTNKDERYGWVNRAIPSVTQRKPWNPEPWTPNHQIITLRGNIELLERRLGKDLPDIHNAAKSMWSKKTKQSYKWLELPVRMGGVGIYPFVGWVTHSRLSPGQKPQTKIDNLTGKKEVKWIELNAVEQKAYQQRTFNAKMIADDVPGVQKYHSQALVRQYHSMNTEWVKEEIPRTLEVNRTWPTCEYGSRPEFPKLKHIKHEPINNSFPALQVFLREYPIVKEIKEVPSLVKMLEVNYPSFYKGFRSYEMNGWHRTDAFELAMGNVPTEPLTKINPTLAIFVKLAVKKTVGYLRGRRNIARAIYAVTQATCKQMSIERIHHLFKF